MNTTDWAWGAEHPERLEHGSPEIREPQPMRPTNQDSHGKLAVPGTPGTPPLSKTYTQQAYHNYNMMTRSASPVVLGQGDRRPLSMGNPGVLGLWAFAMVTILLACFNLFLPTKSNHIILPTALLYGGIAQYIAGFLDLFYGGTFSGTILVSYGAFWAGSGMMMLPSVAATLEIYDPKDLAQANAVYHFFWSFYTLMLIAISLKIKSGTFVLTWCLFWVFVTLFLTAIYYLTDNIPLLRVSGVTAFLAALGAYYSGVAAIFEEQGQKLWVGKYPWNRKYRHQPG